MKMEGKAIQQRRTFWQWLKKYKGTIISFIIAVALAVIMIYPLLWMISTSLKEDVYVYNTGVFYSDWKFSNYVDVFTDIPLARATFNSLIIGVPPLIVSLFVCSVAAFAFAKLNFVGKNIVFMFLLSTMMIPSAVVMIPQYVLFKMLGLLKQGAMALIIPKLFGGIFTIFFMRQYMYSIPDSLIEAGKIDGARYIGMIFTIVIPLSMPVIITQLIMGFIGTWGDYMGPLIFIRDRNWWTVPLEVARYNSGVNNNADLAKLMAASVISMIPIFIVFAIFQKKIIGSIMVSGMKL